MSTSTSRIARKPVVVPAGVEVKMEAQVLSVKGPKGKLTVDIHPYVEVTCENNEIKVKSNNNCGEVITGSKKKLFKAIPGTTRANINNAILGVSEGTERKINLVGVGYRAATQTKGKDKVVALSLGFSHPTEFVIPEGITIETPTQTEILIKGSCEITTGQVAAEIRAFRPPEPYKGKGARYGESKGRRAETVEIKETKKK